MGLGPKIIYYEFDRSRSGKVPSRLFAEYAGSLQVDGYKGYDPLFRANQNMVRIGCMAHVRRGFIDFLKTMPDKSRKAHPAYKICGIIKSLYEVESSIKGMSPVERIAARQLDSTPCFDDLQKLVTAELNAVATSGVYGKALAYANKELSHIRNYLANGHAQIDKNLIENSIRPFALGRRNWLFADTERGAQTSAAIYSVLNTAKANGLEPQAYLTRLLEVLPSCSSLSDYEALLP